MGFLPLSVPLASTLQKGGRSEMEVEQMPLERTYQKLPGIISPNLDSLKSKTEGITNGFTKQLRSSSQISKYRRGSLL